MSKRYAPIVMVTAVLLVVAFVGYVWPASEPLLPVTPLPDRVLFENTAGKVVFDHKKHFEDYKVECQACHHDREKPTPIAQACTSCHGAMEDPNFRTEHLTTFKDQMSCVKCHHAAFEAPEEIQEGAIPLATKENTVSTKSILRDKGWITINPAYANCTVCHLDKEVEDLIPSRMQAFHAKCMTCHEDLGKGPYGQDTCNQCHTK